MLAAGATSDQARRTLTASLTRLSTGEGGRRLASLIASSDPKKAEQMSDHLWTVLLVLSK